MAFNGVPVEGWTLASQEGTNLALPIAQRYLACPNIATRREATIPKLAPPPIKLLAHFQPILWKAIENAAFSDIYIYNTHTYIYTHYYYIINDDPIGGRELFPPSHNPLTIN